MEITHRISLNFKKEGYQKHINIKQNDTATHIIAISFMNGTEPINISEKTTVTMFAVKSDGTQVWNDCEVKDNEVIYKVTTQTVSCIGEVVCEIRINEGNSELTSPKFTLLVENTNPHPHFQLIEEEPEDWVDNADTYYTLNEMGVAVPVICDFENRNLLKNSTWEVSSDNNNFITYLNDAKQEKTIYFSDFSSDSKSTIQGIANITYLNGNSAFNKTETQTFYIGNKERNSISVNKLTKRELNQGYYGVSLKISVPISYDKTYLVAEYDEATYLNCKTPYFEKDVYYMLVNGSEESKNEYNVLIKALLMAKEFYNSAIKNIQTIDDKIVIEFNGKPTFESKQLQEKLSPGTGIEIKENKITIDTEVIASKEDLSKINDKFDDKEDVSNKTTSINDTSTDEQYPSAKAVFDFINYIITNSLGNIKNHSASNVTFDNPKDLLLDSVNVQDAIRQLERILYNIGNQFDEAKEIIKTNSETLDNKEDVSNKVQTIDYPSIDKYPTTKAVLDYIDSLILDIMVMDTIGDNIPTSEAVYNFVLSLLKGYEGVNNKTTSIDDNSTDEQYPSAKAVWDFVLAHLEDKKADKQELQERIETVSKETANLKSNLNELGINTTPNYIVTEAERVAKAVQSVRTAKALVFPVMTDFHLKDGDSAHNASLISLQYASMGIKQIAKHIDLDFVGLLGDYSYMASANYTAEQTIKDMVLCKKTLDFANNKSIWCVGNHDWCYGSGVDRMLTEDELYTYVGANGDGVKPYDSIERGYGYLDFEEQKIRVIYMNTQDCKDAIDNGGITKDSYNYMEFISPTQLRWLADVALNFNNKGEGWGVVILSHHPLDYGYGWFKNVLKILEAYKEKRSITIAVSNLNSSGTPVGTNDTFDFTNMVTGEIICNIHGHIHNCGSKLVSSSDSVTPWLWRFCVPNICANRYNEKWDTIWGEVDENGNKVQWIKETGTAKATSFNIVSIDRKNKKIYAHIFGAGKDRGFDYANGTEINMTGEPTETTEYTITSTLVNCTSASGNSSTIEANGTATLTFTANSGYELPDTVTVSGATYTWNKSTGTLTLRRPTGNVTIGITATEVVTEPEEPVADLFSFSTRAFTTLSGTNFIENTATRDIDYTKCFAVDTSGRRGAYPSGKFTNVTMAENGFTATCSSSSGYGIEFPVKLESGKTYAVTYTPAGKSHRLIKFNADTTLNSVSDAMYGNGATSNTFTTEEGYLYSVVFYFAPETIEFTDVKIEEK